MVVRDNSGLCHVQKQPGGDCACHLAWAKRRTRTEPAMGVLVQFVEHIVAQCPHVLSTTNRVDER